MSLEAELGQLLIRCQAIEDFRNLSVASGIVRLPTAGGPTDPPERAMQLHPPSIPYKIYQELRTLVGERSDLKDWIERQHAPKTGEDVIRLIYGTLDHICPKHPKPRGRKKADYETVQSEKRLAANWEQARETGTLKTEFAQQEKMTANELDALLDRVAARKRRSDK